MNLTEFYLAQLERETPSTRAMLARVPEGKNDWRPHEKSMLLGYLAAHVASLPSWIEMTIKLDSFNWVPNGPRSKYTPVALGSTTALLEVFDQSVADARESLKGTTEDHLMKPWQFLVAGRVVVERPRHEVITDTVFSHLSHHRAQLGVYLRLNDVALPATYGPSADEGRG